MPTQHDLQKIVDVLGADPCILLSLCISLRKSRPERLVNKNDIHFSVPRMRLYIRIKRQPHAAIVLLQNTPRATRKSESERRCTGPAVGPYREGRLFRILECSGKDEKDGGSFRYGVEITRPQVLPGAEV